MEIFAELLNDRIGLLSLFTILFSVGILVFIGVYATRKVLHAQPQGEAADRQAEAMPRA